MSSISKRKYFYAILAFMAILIAFLVTVDLLIISQQKDRIHESFKNHASQEADLVRAALREPMIRKKYSRIEEFLKTWSKKHDRLVELTAMTPNNSILFSYMRPSPVEHQLTTRRVIQYSGKVLLTVYTTLDLDFENQKLETLTQEVITGSILFTLLLGSALWGTMKKLAITPLNKEIIMRRDVQHDLINTIKELNDIRFALDEHAIVAITDAEGTITYANDKFSEIAKYSKEELISQDHRIINSGHHSKEFFSDLWSTIQGADVWKGVIKNKAKDGSYYWVNSTIVPFVNDVGKPYQYVVIRTDVTKQKEAEEKLKEYTLELEQFNHLAVGRELTMIDLKKQINQLLGELNRQPEYGIVDE